MSELSFHRMFAWLIAAALLAATPAHALSTKDFVKCARSVNKAAQKQLKVMLKAKSGCVERLLSCKLGEELSGGDFGACSTTAVVKCETKIGKAVDKIAAKLASTPTNKCSLLQNNLQARFNGLGYRNLIDICAQFGGSIVGRDNLGACLAAAVTCRSDDLLEQIAPRAYEVLDAAGLLTALGTDAFRCLDARAPSPASPSAVQGDLERCQKGIDKSSAKAAKAQAKGLHACADGFVECKIGSERKELDTTGVSECLSKRTPKCNKLLDKADAKTSDRSADIDAACASVPVGDLLSGLGFDATCSGAATPSDVRDCVVQGADFALERAVGTVEPRACDVLGANGLLTGNEDVCLPFCGNAALEDGEVCDDGNRDPLDGCTNACEPGPTAFETISLPSPAHPAETPDGTAGTAVAPGSTLATQFGSTVFNLNNATYTRVYAPGAGDPDVVLILVPGFAAGAHTFKFLAETMVAKALAETPLVLEVWEVDRRTNQLEDGAGAEIAEADHDPELALNWFFGNEIGLPLDARISRRAVFHSGPDVAFIANFTPNVFARDINVIVDAAHALPSSPAVFLGGHSLGTTFTARYAATDFDTGAGIDAGYSKLNGLVLFEGGAFFGGTGSPPTSDQLDLIIARADGGLFHAVQSGAASCVDGTPCPGGDADCAGVPLPSGALTNKCVDPVEAYTGANGGLTALITPQVHAAGDITAIQGRTAPDDLSIISKDYGGGPGTAAVDLVAGLGLLGSLPDASAEAGLGLFLDDDFSPVSAFRVSMGYSDNGLNVTLPGVGIILPTGSTFDPLRVWKGIDEPMPVIAVPDNGSAGGNPNKVNGQEVEVTRIETMFALMRAGETNFGDWYFASSGLSTTDGLQYDSTPLSVTRGRPDIENTTQGSAIDIPVIAFGGTNGLTPTAGSYKAFADAIGPCTAASCSGAPRVVTPDPVNTVYGGVAGGYEVYLSEGYAHIDVVTVEDGPANPIYDELMAFLERNTP